MAISICAFNSVEMSNEELVKDDLHFFYKQNLSNMFCDLTLRPELVYELAELDQIGKLTNIDISPIYAMSIYWDKIAEAEHLSYFSTEAERTKQLKTIHTNNENLVNNLNLVYQTIVALETKLSTIDNLEKRIINSDNIFFNNNTYFSKLKGNAGDNFHEDIKTIKEFLVFAKSMGGDTTYFKYKPDFEK